MGGGVRERAPRLGDLGEPVQRCPHPSPPSAVEPAHRPAVTVEHLLCVRRGAEGLWPDQAAHRRHVSPQACPLPREPVSFQSLLLRPVLRLDGATWRALSGMSWRISASVFSPAGCESRPPSRMTGAQGGPQCPVWLPIQWLRHCHPHLDMQWGLKGQRCRPWRTGRVMAIPGAVGSQPTSLLILPSPLL